MENLLVGKAKRNKWLKSILILSILAFVFFGLKSCDPFYSDYNTFYNRVILNILHFLRSLLLVPLYLVFLVIVFFRLARIFIKYPILSALQPLFSGAVKLVAFFFIIWGFHYSRTDLSEVKSSELSEIEQMYKWSSKMCNELRSNIDYNSNVLTLDLPKEYEDELKSALEKEARSMDPQLGKVLWPKAFLVNGGLRKVGIGGIYFPFTGEPLYDDSYLLVKKLFTYSHEFFHGIGVTGEDECNYLAFKTLKESKNELFQYAAFLDLMLTSKYLLGITSEEAAKNLSDQVNSDIEVLREDNLKYKSSLQSVSSTTNDIYLKMLSSNDGVDAYNMYLKWIDME